MEKPNMAKLSVAEAIGKSMKENGVEYFFYVMGGGSAGMRQWEEKVGIKTIMCRNEKAATNMADGYARVTKKPTVCYSQHGAAAAILASMMYEPMAAHSPVVALTGATPTSRKDQWLYQECYEIPYFQSTCKFNVDVTDVQRRCNGCKQGRGVYAHCHTDSCKRVPRPNPY